MKDKIIDIFRETMGDRFDQSWAEDSATRIVELKEEYDLAYCNNCIQMTNHIKGVCQKCKAKEEPTDEELDKVIDDICILEERITMHYQATQPLMDSIEKLQHRQRNAIKELLKQ